VIAKCGEINIWHWAHRKAESCDDWYEPETEWHRNWKLIFGKEHTEVVIQKDGIRHIADIKTKDNVIIELQNSPIQKQVVQRREIFYGERMLWVINGVGFKENFRSWERQDGLSDDYYRARDYHESPEGWIDQDTGELIPRLKKEGVFTWSRPRKSWADVQRPVFIDFGDERIFRVFEGMGSASGKGKYIPKVDFIEKYGGDLNLLDLVVVNKK
jgi:hypothetical protein